MNFNSDIYGRAIKIEFLKRLRDEVKFESKEALIHQIKTDKQKAQEIIMASLKTIFLKNGTRIKRIKTDFHRLAFEVLEMPLVTQIFNLCYCEQIKNLLYKEKKLTN